MTMIISKSVESVKRERAIIKEMSDYFTANKFDSTNPEMVEKLEGYLYKLFESNITDIGYEPRLIHKGQERDFYLDPNDEMKKVVNLSFCRLGKQKGGDSHGGIKFEYKGNMIYPQLRIRINSDIYDQIESPIDIYNKIEALYHEMNHIKQFINLRNQESSFENLINGCAMVGMFKNDMYKQKYDKIPFESDSYTNFELFEHIGIDRKWFGGINQQILNFDYFTNRAKQNNPAYQDALLDILDSNISPEDITKCPILGKLYNPDATKKTALELINNMNKEISEIIGNDEVDEYDKRSKIKDCKGMYYEIIYRALTKENIDSKKFEIIKEAYGENNDLIKEISNYFEEKREQELAYINGIKKIDGFKNAEQYQGYCNVINKNIDNKIEFLDGIQEKYHNHGAQDINTQTIVTEQENNTTETKIEDLDLKSFMLKLVSSYRTLETNAQYDKRVDREESDIEYVAEYVNNYRVGNVMDNECNFGGIHPEIIDKTGKADFSKDNIDRMFRMINAANNLTVGNQKYLRDFCESPEIQNLLKQMQESPAVQNMINRAETEKKMGNQGRGSLRGETPAERDVHLARKGFKSLKEKAEMSSRDDNYVFNTIIDDYHINYGYETEEDFALAKVCGRQRGIRVESRALQGKYKLDIVDQTNAQDFIEPQKIKQDTIIAGVNISDIIGRTKLFRDKFSRQKEDKGKEKEI